MQIREKMQANLGMPDKDSDYTYAYDITEEISSFRHSNYIQQTTFTALSKKPTDTELLQFSTQARHNKHLHYSHIITHKLSSKQKYIPIFILTEHRQKHADIANKT